MDNHRPLTPRELADFAEHKARGRESVAKARQAALDHDTRQRVKAIHDEEWAAYIETSPSDLEPLYPVAGHWPPGGATTTKN